MPLDFIVDISFGEGAGCNNVVRAGTQNDAIPHTDAIGAISKHSNRLSVHFQRSLRRIAVHPHIGYPVGSLGIKAGVDVDSWRRRPVGFVEEVRVLPYLWSKVAMPLVLMSWALPSLRTAVAKSKEFQMKVPHRYGLVAHRGPVLFVNVGLVFFRLGPVARLRATQRIVRVQRDSASGAVFRYRHGLCRPSVVQGVKMRAQVGRLVVVPPVVAVRTGQVGDRGSDWHRSSWRGNSSLTAGGQCCGPTRVQFVRQLIQLFE